jgi:hypothetical protein
MKLPLSLPAAAGAAVVANPAATASDPRSLILVIIASFRLNSPDRLNRRAGTR